ncbi:hypothetical protein LPJ66_001773 [Kickxella alabastrina]|uniref:Uncharacterized protein n=1 Tax=Kickxella alabastrina TaxID=61397 RepID=A0ACC1ISK9_9FUNG|nr:hypothetical protein LPJ66_001773 [Kickxella alabastrina]
MIANQVTEFGKVCFYLSLTPTILAIEGVRWALTFNTETKLAVATTCAPVESKVASITGMKKANAERIQQLEKDLADNNAQFEKTRADDKATIEQALADKNARIEQLGRGLVQATSAMEQARTDAEAVRADAVARIQQLELIIEQSGAVLGVTLANSNVRIGQLERIVEHSAGVFGQALANNDARFEQLGQVLDQAATMILQALHDDNARIEQLERGAEQSVATNKKARADHISRIEQLERGAEQAAVATEQVRANYKAAHAAQHSELVKANLDLHRDLAVLKSKLDGAEDRLHIQCEHFKALRAELCKANGELDVAHTNNEAQQKLATELCDKVQLPLAENDKRFPHSEPAAADSMLHDRHKSTDDLDAELCKAECELDAACKNVVAHQQRLAKLRAMVDPRLAVSDKRIPQANQGGVKNILHAQRQNAKALCAEIRKTKSELKIACASAETQRKFVAELRCPNKRQVTSAGR